jgi:hypothetical protein
MTIIDQEMLWRQFEPTLAMLGDALRDCQEELWADQPDQLYSLRYVQEHAAQLRMFLGQQTGKSGA